MTQAHIFYSGTVQGVGFRYTVQRFASDLGLNGWVKNLRDGRVEILMEGKKELIEQLIEQLGKYFAGYISQRDLNYGKAEGILRGFCITY